MKKYKVLFLPLIIFSFNTNACNTWYVSPTGDNTTGDGSINKPYLTINKASTSSSPCDTIYLRGGTYYAPYTMAVSKSGTFSAPITIANYPGEYPIIDNTGYQKNDVSIHVRGSYIDLGGFEIKNGNIGIWAVGKNIKIHHMTIHGMYNQAILGNNDYLTLSYNHAYNNGLSRPATNGASLPSIIGTYITTRYLVGISIIGNTVHNNYGEAIQAYLTDGAKVVGNTVYDNLHQNIYISGSINCIVKNNLIYNTPESLNKNATGNGIILTNEIVGFPSYGNVIINNFLENVDLHAFDWSVVTGGLDRVLIANNTIVNGKIMTGSPGYNNIVQPSGSTIMNNITYRNDGGTISSNRHTTGITFTNNLWFSTQGLTKSTPEAGASSIYDLIGIDPKLVLNNTSTLIGNQTKGLWSPSLTSPVLGTGAPISWSTSYTVVTSDPPPYNIGASVQPKIVYTAR